MWLQRISICADPLNKEENNNSKRSIDYKTQQIFALQSTWVEYNPSPQKDQMLLRCCSDL